MDADGIGDDGLRAIVFWFIFFLFLAISDCFSCDMGEKVCEGSIFFFGPFGQGLMNLFWQCNCNSHSWRHRWARFYFNCFKFYTANPFSIAPSSTRAIAPGLVLFLLLALSNRFRQQVSCQTADGSAFFFCPFFQSFLNLLWQVCGNSSPWSHSLHCKTSQHSPSYAVLS